MKTQLLNYPLPTELIANVPVSPRDSSRLMVVNRKTGDITTTVFSAITDLLGDQDVLVFNNSKVFPARLFGVKPTGGKVEVLLTEHIAPTVWRAIFKGTIQQGRSLLFGDMEAEITVVTGNEVELTFLATEQAIDNYINTFGHTPIPPYIRSDESEKVLRQKYQTVYAKTPGSIAAPTAGFHFTQALIKSLQSKGVQIEYLTLHVGLGTFLPVKSVDIENHPMHFESYEIDLPTFDRLNLAKAQGKRIVSVGTTTTRVLEACSNKQGQLISRFGQTDIFIYPPYKFKFINCLITNYHLPKSTLLALVSAFVSYPNTPTAFTNFTVSLLGQAYTQAISQRCRFYSFGDSMIIL